MEENNQSVLPTEKEAVSKSCCGNCGKKSCWKWVFLAAIFLLTASLVYAGYQFSQKPSPLPLLTPTSMVQLSPSPTPNPIANWKTYKDNLYKFEIKYPETNSDYAKGLMPVKQYLDNDLSVGYRLLLLKTTLKKQYFEIYIRRINQKISLLEYWKTESAIAKSGLIFNNCDQNKCVGSYQNSSKPIEFNLKNNEVSSEKALTVTNTMPLEFQETVIFKLTNDYIMEINKGTDTLSNQILSTFKFLE